MTTKIQIVDTHRGITARCGLLGQIFVLKVKATEGSLQVKSTRMFTQVLFHLQMRDPPILPPICLLFGQPKESVSQRPLHAGQAPDFSTLRVRY